MLFILVSNTGLGFISHTHELLTPFGSDIEGLIENLHISFLSIGSIAWDLAITPEGPVVIEGNGGWRVLHMQRLLKKPMLNERFIALYTK